MSDTPRFAEDLRALAAEAAELAPQLCGPCQNFHLLWPYLRLAGASVNPDATQTLKNVLEDELSRGGSILIAGAADTGLLAVVAQSAGPDTRIAVLDRCETPLELCRRFARRWSLAIETLHVNLMDLSLPASFDVVLAHSVLQFIPAERRVDVLARLRRALRPGGRLLLNFRTGGRIEGGLLPEYRERYPRHLIEQLEAAGVALPEPREAFHQRVADYSEERRPRQGAHFSRADVEQLIDAAGFRIDDVMSVESPRSAPFRELTAKIGKQRFLAIARAKEQIGE
jgi:SAM-dependent methyltransferase